MRCPDCNKFVSYDAEGDPEVDVRVDDDGSVSGTVRISNNCQECGTELKAAELEVEADFTEEVKAHREAFPNEKHHLDVELEASRTERTQDKDRHGKQIKSRRYMKTFYGAEGTITVTCSCGKPCLADDEPGEMALTQDWSDEVQASGMDEQV